MDTTGSVSKGCFAFKGKKKRLKAEDYLPEDKLGGASRRHDRFIGMWEELDTEVQVLQADLNSKIFEDLLNFASDSHLTFNSDGRSNVVSKEIPTAALVTGVNTPDHSVMFSNMVAMLQDRITPLVATLKSKNCQNVKSILGKTLSQLLGNPNLEHEEEEEEEEINTKRLPLTLSSLAKWYKNKFMIGPSSPKKRKSSDGNAHFLHKFPPVIIVFEDFESFPPKVVQDFVTIASNYVDQLPLVFVFGIATSVSAVHRLLPNEVSSLLCMEKFQAPPSSEYLTLVINQVLMTPKFPFKLGGKVFQLLLDIFLYHDFSVLSFNKGLRFAMLDHYFNQPLSFLCCPKDEIPDIVDKMNKNIVEKLRQLPSFMRYVEKCTIQEQPELLLNDKFTKGRIKTLVNGIHEYHENFFPVLKCVHALVSKLPSYPLGKQLREVYSMSLESNIFETESYKQAMELLKMMSKDDLKQLVIQCLAPLREASDLISQMVSDVETYLHRFDTLDEVVEEEEEDTSEEKDQTNLPSRTSLHHLRQQLQDMSKRKKKLSPYEKLRLELITYLDGEFRKFILCPKMMPLYEVFYYDSAANIRRHLNASPRSALQMALSNPHHYLQCECCKSENNQILPMMPDVCILYKLHLECGQLINLYDWMQAFLTVIEADENEEEPGKPPKELQARFIRAVSELQFLGFIKPTKRKTDHVARLTWGGC